MRRHHSRRCSCELYRFAEDALRLGFVFWGTEEALLREGCPALPAPPHAQATAAEVRRSTERTIVAALFQGIA